MKEYHVFISHSWENTGLYKQLVKLLRDNRFSYVDHSFSKDNPVGNPTRKAITQRVRKTIESCSMVIVLATEESTDSSWVRREIDIARSNVESKKPILAIGPPGNEITSESIKRQADDFVEWNPSKNYRGNRGAGITPWMTQERSCWRFTSSMPNLLLPRFCNRQRDGWVLI